VGRRGGGGSGGGKGLMESGFDLGHDVLDCIVGRTDIDLAFEALTISSRAPVASKRGQTIIPELNEANASLSDGENVNVISREAVEGDEGRVHRRVFLSSGIECIASEERIVGRIEKVVSNGSTVLVHVTGRGRTASSLPLCPSYIKSRKSTSTHPYQSLRLKGEGQTQHTISASMFSFFSIRRRTS
jgi:hypothetical protein